MKTIAIMNNKGGVGKTVTAINLADILVRDYHKRVVLADCDGQVNMTRFFLPEFNPEDGGTVAEVLTGTHEPYWRANLAELREGLSILPGSPALYDLDLIAIRDGLRDTYALRRFRDAAAEDGETDYFIFAMLEDQQAKVKDRSPQWMVAEQLKDICRREPQSAELIAQDLENPAMSITEAEKKIKAFADGHKTGAFSCVSPVEAENILRKFYGLPAPEKEPGGPGPQLIELADFLR